MWSFRLQIFRLERCKCEGYLIMMGKNKGEKTRRISLTLSNATQLLWKHSGTMLISLSTEGAWITHPFSYMIVSYLFGHHYKTQNILWVNTRVLQPHGQNSKSKGVNYSNKKERKKENDLKIPRVLCKVTCST